VHSEDVTRQLTDEHERLASLLATMLEQLGALGWTPPAGEDQASEVRFLESQLLARVDELTQKVTGERDGLIQVVTAIEQELRQLRSTPVSLPANPPSDGSSALLKAQVAEIHTMLSDRALAAPGADGDPNALSDVLACQIADIRAQLAEERAGRDAWLQSVAHRLALRLQELNGPPGAADQDDGAVLSELRALARSVFALVSRASSDVSLDAVADDLEAMRKELDERLTTIEAALADIRSSLRST
jgi:hypothetical protein